MKEIPWNYASIHIPKAWDFLEKTLEEEGRQQALKDVKVALIDTGITPHPCFGSWKGGNRYVAVNEGKNYIEGKGSPPFEPFKNIGNGSKSSGHGTRVGSVIAADSDEMRGVAHGVTLVPYRVTEDVIDPEFAEALNHARENDCQVANISLGWPLNWGETRELRGQAVDDAYEAGMIVVAAAGNIIDKVTYPGKHARTIAVGGVTRDKKGTLIPWAGGTRGSQGERIDFCAPADEIRRAAWKDQGGEWESRWAPDYGDDGAGTSYATAHVSGLACLWLARWGGKIQANYGKTWQVTEAFRHVAKEACFNKGRKWNKSLFGEGIIDAEKVLKAPLPPPNKLKKTMDIAKNDRW